MLLTEEEAKTKWCPHARSGEPDEGSGWNRYKDHGCCCIASECMAWTWAIGSDDVGGFKRVNPEDNRKLGSCGLAGKAE